MCYMFKLKKNVKSLPEHIWYFNHGKLILRVLINLSSSQIKNNPFNRILSLPKYVKSA